VRWNSLVTNTNSLFLWVIKLNAYNTVEWNSSLKVGVLFMFHCILCDSFENNTMKLSIETNLLVRLSTCIFSPDIFNKTGIVKRRSLKYEKKGISVRALWVSTLYCVILKKKREKGVDISVATSHKVTTKRISIGSL